ncbi:hypothetical protein CF326_g7956 [Tilletia indica]|nr:hypothetical protein CF326_g7956 [Tilletia indica]
MVLYCIDVDPTNAHNGVVFPPPPPSTGRLSLLRGHCTELTPNAQLFDIIGEESAVGTTLKDRLIGTYTKATVLMTRSRLLIDSIAVMPLRLHCLPFGQNATAFGRAALLEQEDISPVPSFGFEQIPANTNIKSFSSACHPA